MPPAARPPGPVPVVAALLLTAALLGPPAETARAAAVELPTVAAPLARAAGPAVGSRQDRFWVTSPTDPGRRLRLTRPVATPLVPASTVVVDPAVVRQRWIGTGASLTDASLGLLRGDRAAAHLLYGAHRTDGARLDLVRMPLSSTDFSSGPWSWLWHPSTHTATVPHQQRVAAAYVRHTLRRLAPGLRAIGTSWSAPAVMKDSSSLDGGGLVDADRGEYADLLVDQASWLRSHGVPLAAMTLGNEPFYSADYPSMTMSDLQMAMLARGVSPRLHRLGVQLWALDHNWSDAPNLLELLALAPGSFDAAAFHCYGGSPAQMAGSVIPGVVTECTGTDGGWASTFDYDSTELVAGAVAAGSTGLMMWNLALDPHHGPVDTASADGCKTCRGLLTVDPHASGGAAVTRQPEFYVLAQLARAARPGARVIASTATPGLVVAAFRNPDGSIGVYGEDLGGSARTVTIRDGAASTSYALGPHEIFSYRS